MKTILFPFLMVSMFATAQNNRPIKEVDSVDFYRGAIIKMQQAAFDSLHKSQAYLETRKNLVRSLQNSKSHHGLVVFSEIVYSDYGGFNDTLANNGFPELKPISSRYGIGVGGKGGDLMYYLYFGTYGAGPISRKNNESIRVYLANFFQLELGVDLLNMERFSFYPYGGASVRVSEIRYVKRGGPNSNYTNFSNMNTDENEVVLSSVRMGYNYGVGFDYSFAYNREKTFKGILFLKAGVNKPVKRDIHKSDGIRDYNAGIKQGERILTIGIKLGNKR